MLSALDKNSKRRYAWLVEKYEGPFHCNFCQDELILRKGPIREHHFAHKPPFNCKYGGGESQIHLKIKKEIYSELKNHPQCTKCEIERNLVEVRPDVSLYIRNKPVAIEIQHSKISIDEIKWRCEQYYKKGIYALWIVPKIEFDEDVENYRPNIMEKYLHSLYFGRIYYWSKGALVKAFHFYEHKVWVEESHWYERDGSEQSAGGYYKDSKSLREPVELNDKLHIADDFKPVEKEEFITKNWSIPKSRIWIDKMKKFW